MKQNDIQIGGDHYKGYKIQTWDFIADHKMDFMEGNIVKYVDRWKHKDGLKDLMKARHYLDKLIELNTPEDQVCFEVGERKEIK